jgi:hypothetical protein
MRSFGSIDLLREKRWVTFITGQLGLATCSWEVSNGLNREETLDRHWPPPRCRSIGNIGHPADVTETMKMTQSGTV